MFLIIITGIVVFIMYLLDTKQTTYFKDKNNLTPNPKLKKQTNTSKPNLKKPVNTPNSNLKKPVNTPNSNVKKPVNTPNSNLKKPEASNSKLRKPGPRLQTMGYNYTKLNTLLKRPKKNNTEIKQFVNTYLASNNVQSLLNLKPYKMEDASIDEVVENIKFQYTLSSEIKN